jgi:hypothetical protein
MKSPWKLVAELVSRRRASGRTDTFETERNANGNGDSLKALPVPAPSPLPEQNDQVPEAEEAIAHAEPSVPRKEGSGTRDVQLELHIGAISSETNIGVSPVADARKSHATSGFRSPVLVEESSPRKGTAFRKKRLGSAEGEMVAVTNIPRPQPIPLDTKIENPLTDLDAEIVQLRKLLAGKLRQQNAQLRSLLKRYDIQ